MANLGIVTNTIPSSQDQLEDKSGLTLIVAQVLEATGTIAAAGTTQATATPIVHALEWVTGANATAGAVLPAAVTNMLGASLTVKNDDTANAILKIYPAGTDQINVLGASTAISMAAKTAATFFCTAVGQWHTVPLVPS